MSGPLTDKRLGDFSELSPESVRVLDELGFEFATPVQAATIPLFTGHKDVVVDACTGSGKTLAFVLPVVEKLRRLEVPLKKHQVGAVVISPTRELASQIFNVSIPFVESIPNMKARLLVGGTDIQVDFADMASGGNSVLVGTPGRLLDVLTRSKALCVSTVEVLVLDEADRLLDLGFETTLLSIIGRLPKQRRTGLFSATQAEAVEVLVKAGMRNPIRVNVATTRKKEDGKLIRVDDLNQKTPYTLQAEYVVCSMKEKINQLVAFISANQSRKIIVYFLTCACVDYFLIVFRRLRKLQGIFIQSLHGKMKQIGREKAIKAFTEAAQGVLLATDVAARGLDIPDVDWVVQFDAPQDPSAFVHRVGRTARMGRNGCARIYLSADEEEYTNFIILRKVPMCQKSPDNNADSILDELRTLSETDREIMTKGILAFVSFIRAYANHHCSFIFRLANIDYVGLAQARGLLTLPKVPEIRKFGKNLDAFVASKVNPDDVPFRDNFREKQRQQGDLRRGQAVIEQEKKLLSDLQPPEIQCKAESKEKKCRNPKQRDFEELQEDYALLKLLKKGKITDKQFDQAMGFDLDDMSTAVIEMSNTKQVSYSALENKGDKACDKDIKSKVNSGMTSSVKSSSRKRKRRGGDKNLRKTLI